MQPTLARQLRRTVADMQECLIAMLRGTYREDRDAKNLGSKKLPTSKYYEKKVKPFVFVLILKWVLLCSTGWTGTHYLVQANFKLNRDWPASTS